MSKGIADLYARSQVSAKVNDRYLEALATLDTSRARGRGGLADLPPSPVPRQIDSGSAALVRGRPATAGRGRGLWLGRGLPQSRYRPSLSRPSGPRGFRKVTYLLRLLREHKIIRRLPKTRKYRLTPKGAKIIATIFLTQKATTEQLNKAAA